MAAQHDENLPVKHSSERSKPAGREFVATVSAQAGHSIPSEDRTREKLHALGAETETERKVKRIAPFVVSALVHLGVVVIALVAASTVMLLSRDKPPTLVVANFDDLRYDPVVRRDVEQGDPIERSAQDRLPVESLTTDITNSLVDLKADPLSILSDASAMSPLADFAPSPMTARVEFSGLSSTNARRIVYVIDASGSMIRSLQIVVKELARSIDALSTQQRFGVVFFQSNEATIVPPASELIVGSGPEKLRVLEWIDRNVHPKGSSNPLAALRYALDQKPDVIFVLSENITGSGQHEIDQRDLMAMLDELNPVIDEKVGRRRTQINCIQFREKDPLDTLRLIAERHGGVSGYKFVSAQELGLESPK